MKGGSPEYKDLELKIVGSNLFGRFPQISPEETFNMIISDDALVPFAGYARVVQISDQGVGRAIFSSQILKKLFVVIDNDIYAFDRNFAQTYIGQMDSYEGDVFIDENNNGQVIFSDQQSLYIYDILAAPTFSKLTATDLGFRPGYLTFQTTYIISPGLDTHFWYISGPNQAKSWNASSSQQQGAIETKPGNCVACVRFPGRGNLLLVFGDNVTELWQNVGATLFPYQRNQNTNIDYGCINPATIATNEKMVCWVGQNEKSGIAIMYTNGANIQKISTDGIDYKLSQLQHPSDCYGYMLRLDGHVCYIVTWVKDNLSYLYDFNTGKFYTLTDENMNAFIPKAVAFFDERYFFVSIRDGNLYEISSEFPTYDYGDGDVKEIPQIRVCPTMMLPDQSRFKTGYVGFTVRQGNFNFTLPADDLVPRIDLTISNDNGVNYGSAVSIDMFPLGQRANRLMWYNLGAANNLTCQFRFHGYGKYIVKDGIQGIMQ